MLLALGYPATLADWLIWLIIICGAIGIACIVMKVCDVWPPPWLLKILLIVAAVVVGAVAIRFISQL